MAKNEHPYQERAAYTWSEDSIRLIMTPSALAKSIYFYVQEAGYFKTDDAYFTERKNLNSFLIVYTLSGKGILKYRDHSYPQVSGCCFWINCLEHHYYETAHGENWEFLWVHFNGNNALGYFQEFSKNGFQVQECQDKFFMESTLRRIVSLNQKRNASTELLSSNLLGSLLTELTMQTMLPDSQTIFIPDYLKGILKEIDQNFKTNLALDTLAQSHGVSKFYLSREFKKFMGVTVNEYIITTRLSYAKELLKYSDQSVSDITYAIGMNNVSHFINLFKAREGVTPLAYRKEWRI